MGVRRISEIGFRIADFVQANETHFKIRVNHNLAINPKSEIRIPKFSYG
jgi:hypothetical protein